MSVGLRMPENFEGFKHKEKVLGREIWQIDLGRSNAVFFEQLSGHMFEQVTVLSAGDDPSVLRLDAVIEPSIDAFEFAVPDQTKTDAFAVWIKYRIKVFDRAGDLVANFPLSAYGKSLTTTMGGSEALQRAAVLAMRDAAALMIIKFGDPALVSALVLPEETAAVEKQGAEETTANAAIPGGSSDE